MARHARPSVPTPANRLGLDYRAEAARLGAPVVPIIDAHTHIHGERASRIYDEARRLFGVVKTYSMTQIGQAPVVREALGDSVRFIAIPTWSDPDKASAHGMGYVKTIERFRREFDARIMKVWASPRLRNIVTGEGAVDVRDIDSPARVAAREAGRDLGMMYMVHVADPDTWFATKYADPAKYGTSRRTTRRWSGCWIGSQTRGSPRTWAVGRRTWGSSTACFRGTATCTSTHRRPSGWCGSCRGIRSARPRSLRSGARQGGCSSARTWW